MRVRPAPLTATAVSALAILFALSASSTVHASCDLVPEQTRVVTKVATDNTLILDDGTQVVLIGALPPTNLDASTRTTWPPAETSQKALEALTSGQSIGLAFSGRRRDRYGRHLAHIFVERDGARIWVQAHLIAAGHARAYALPGNTGCLADLMDHERSARSAKAGHWATGIFTDQDAHDPTALSRLHDTFQTIEGRVDHVAKIQGHTVLDFSPDHRTGFSIWIPSRANAARKANDQPVDWTGKHVRARGWIEHRRAPRLSLTSPDEVEILDPPAGKPDANPK